jgi:hypothetical protein
VETFHLEDKEPGKTRTRSARSPAFPAAPSPREISETFANKAQSFQKSRKRTGLSAVYRVV